MQHKDDKTKVVQCGSTLLSQAEKNYSTLELELTAIVWAINKCDFFLKGINKFEVVTDHRPLIGIFAKSLPQIDNARITRLREKVSDRPFEVKWLAGKDNVIADALSRAPAPTTAGSTSVPIRACIVAPQSMITNILDCVKNDKAYQDIEPKAQDLTLQRTIYLMIISLCKCFFPSSPISCGGFYSFLR